MIRTAAVVITVIFVAAFTQVAAAVDVDNGATLAKRWCASCHIVEPAQTRGGTQAPPFSEVAGRPGFDAAKLALFLLSPHPVMPDMNLTRNEAADLAAYIETQK